MITDRPDVSSTIEAAARAASVAPDTAMPQSAFFSAGASFTPSPGHADDVTALLQDIHDVELVFREDLRETVGLLDGLGGRAGLLVLGVTQAGRIENVRAHVQLPGGLLGDGQRIARDHLDLHAHLSRGRDGRLGIVPGRIEQGQHAEELPGAVALGPRHAQRTKAARRELVDRLLDGGCHLPGVADNARITCGAPLVTLNVFPSAAFTVASVRLCTGSNGWKWMTW